MPMYAVLLAAVAGGLQAVALAWPAGLGGSGQPLWGLQIASLALLVWLLQASAHARGAAARGWVFATAWLVGTFWWLFISLHTYGGLAAPLAVLAVLGLAAFLGSYYAVVSAIFWRVAHARPALAAIIFAALWLLAELARGWLWTGFPWGAGGYAHADGPLAVLARWVGVYGVGAAAAWLAAWLALQAAVLHAQRRQGRWGARAWRAAWPVLALAAALMALAQQREQALAVTPAGNAPGAAPGLPLTLALLQGNIPQDEKFMPGSGVPLALDWYGAQLLSATAQLVVAPETALPVLPRQLPEGYLQALQARYTQGAQAAMVGIPLGSMAEGYTNAVMGWAPGLGAAYRYDKHHLVPFGEFVPPLFKWFTQMLNIPLGDFNRGAVGQPSMAWAGQRIAPNICYEDLFGEEIAARFANAEAAPTVLLNFSNIGWFGDTVAIDQHLHISRMRALEFERPMVRATNTGATAVIDHQGRVTHRLASHTRGVLHAQVQGRGGAPTPYAWWAARVGLVPLWLLGLLAVALALRWRRQG